MAFTPFTYSMLYTTGSIIGIGGNFTFTQGGSATEGITVAMKGDKNNLTMGSDGQGMHNLLVSDAGEIMIRLLKTSPVNNLFDVMYNLQKAAGQGWGSNVISISNSASGDSFTANGCAFRKRPNVNYATEGGTMEWTFDAIRINGQLGGGVIGNLPTFAQNLAG